MATSHKLIKTYELTYKTTWGSSIAHRKLLQWRNECTKLGVREWKVCVNL